MGILQTLDEYPDCSHIICEVTSFSCCLESVHICCEGLFFLLLDLHELWGVCVDISHNRSFMSSQDLFEVMAYVTSVCINPLDFALVSLALLSLVRSAAISVSVSQSSNLVESCSLKTVISYSKEFVRLGCFCIEHKVSVYCHITSLRGSAGTGGCSWWMAVNRFWSSCCM